MSGFVEAPRAEREFEDYLFTDQGIYKITFLSSPWNRVVGFLWIPCWTLGWLIIYDSQAPMALNLVVFFVLFTSAVFIWPLAVWLDRLGKRSFYKQLRDNPPLGSPPGKLMPWSTVTAAKIRKTTTGHTQNKKD